MASRAVLVDLDGTVWDSHPFYVDALKTLADVPRSPTIERLQHGANLVGILKENSVGLGRFVTTCRNTADQLSIYPNVRETLQLLSDRGCLLGAVTNLPARLATPLLAETQLTELFGWIQTATRGIPSKPHPGLILRALRELARIIHE